MVRVLVGLKYFIFAKSSSCTAFHFHTEVGQARSYIGCITTDRFGRNLDR